MTLRILIIGRAGFMGTNLIVPMLGSSADLLNQHRSTSQSKRSTLRRAKREYRPDHVIPAALNHSEESG